MSKVSLVEERLQAPPAAGEEVGAGLRFEPERAEVERWVERVQRRLLDEHAALFQASLLDPGRVAELRAVIDAILGGEAGTRAHRELLREAVLARIAGFGPLEPLMHDPSVTEIMVNAPDQVFVERAGRIERARGIAFRGDDEVLQLAQRVVARAGRSLNAEEPLVDARLLDGSRVHCAIPPVASRPVITVRRFAGVASRPEDWLALGSLTEGMLEFLAMAVRGKLNIVVAGATATGKTSLLRLLAGFIPPDERLITLEDVDELRLQRPHLVRLEANKRQGLYDLLVNALRMRPDRIILGEVRGKEAVELLDAMGTGHEGSLTTLHSRSPYQDTVKRLARAMLRAQLEIPFSALVDQIRDTVDLVVFLKRFADGSRKVTHVVELNGERYRDILRFEYAGVRHGAVVGEFRYVQHLTDRRRRQVFEHGVEIPAHFGGEAK